VEQSSVSSVEDIIHSSLMELSLIQSVSLVLKFETRAISELNGLTSVCMVRDELDRQVSTVPLITLLHEHFLEIKSFSPVNAVLMAGNEGDSPTVFRLLKKLEWHYREVLMLNVLQESFSICGRRIPLSHLHGDSVEVSWCIARESNTSDLHPVVADDTVEHCLVNLAIALPVIVSPVRGSPRFSALAGKSTIEIV